MKPNLDITRELFERLSAGDIPGVLALTTEDATWRNPGKPELLPSAGTSDMQAMSRIFKRMFDRLENGLKMTVLSTLAEGDRVAAEVESSGDLKNGRKYRNQYHFLLEFRGGKISAVREYLDTQHVHDVWYRP